MPTVLDLPGLPPDGFTAKVFRGDDEADAAAVRDFCRRCSAFFALVAPESDSDEAARHLLEITGHTAAGHRDVLAAWCMRMGCPIEELDAATQSFRSGLDHGQRLPHVEHR